jgi:hypothetical protein
MSLRHAPAQPLSLRELLLLSDFGRANPARVEELLNRCADPATESRPARQERRSE